MRVVIVALALVLAGCASRFEATLDTWIGAGEPQLVAQFGPPSSVYQVSDGSKILTYARQGNAIIPGVAPTYTSTAIGNQVFTRQVGGSPAMSIATSCTINFTIVGETVTSWRYEGNACY